MQDCIAYSMVKIAKGFWHKVLSESMHKEFMCRGQELQADDVSAVIASAAFASPNPIVGMDSVLSESIYSLHVQVT